MLKGGNIASSRPVPRRQQAALGAASMAMGFVHDVPLETVLPSPPRTPYSCL